MTTRTIQTKGIGRRWSTVDTQENSYNALHSLASDLAAKYIGKAPFVRRIERRNNYDGTQTYTVYYDNEYRAVYVTDIY